MFKKAKNYFREAFVELKKVSWPNRKTTLNLTIAVVVISVAVALMVSVYDIVLRAGVSRIPSSQKPTQQSETQTIPVTPEGSPDTQGQQ